MYFNQQIDHRTTNQSQCRQLHESHRLDNHSTPKITTSDNAHNQHEATDYNSQSANNWTENTEYRNQDTYPEVNTYNDYENHDNNSYQNQNQPENEDTKNFQEVNLFYETG